MGVNTKCTTWQLQNLQQVTIKVTGSGADSFLGNHGFFFSETPTQMIWMLSAETFEFTGSI